MSFKNIISSLLSQPGHEQHSIAALTLLAGVALITAGLVGSDPVEANRMSVPIEIVSMVSPAEEDARSADVASTTPLDDSRHVELEVRRGDNMSLIFNRAGLDGSDLQMVLEADSRSKILRSIYPGQPLSFHISGAGDLLEFRYSKSPLETIVFRKSGSGEFSQDSEIRTAEVRRSFRHAVLKSSLFEAGQDAGLSSRMILELANVFGGVMDFALDPRQGDTFSILFEEQYLDGEKIGEGAIVAAEYVNEGRYHTAFRFVDARGDSGYFSADGVSMRKAFLRAPLDFTRVSSNFNMRRLHPIARVIRPHRGVDYSASTGTPVFASGDGRVVTSGYSRSNGNYVFLQHDNKIMTRYLHLHKRLAKTGDRVHQGQTIGTVGSTGLATGPHLHYEFLVDGVHRNPSTVLDNLPRARSLDAREMALFADSIGGVKSQLASYTKAWELAVASNDG